MPSLAEQMEVPGAFTARHVAARLLLRPGRSYEQAVKTFEPYDKMTDPYPEGRAALRRLIDQCQTDQRRLFAFVNNRFEGSAIETIERVISELGPTA